MVYFDSHGVKFSKDMKTLISCPSNFEGSYSVPDGVIEIGDLAFGGCAGLTNVEIPHSVKKIVITSSWREEDMPMQRLKEMWESRHLPGTLADVTPSISQYRGEELAAWLTFCPDNCQYVIIDDLPQDQFLVNQYDHLVTTDGYAGLTRKLAEQAISILNTPMMNTSIYPCLGALEGDTVGSLPR